MSNEETLIAETLKHERTMTGLGYRKCELYTNGSRSRAHYALCWIRKLNKDTMKICYFAEGGKLTEETVQTNDIYAIHYMN